MKEFEDLRMVTLQWEYLQEIYNFYFSMIRDDLKEFIFLNTSSITLDFRRTGILLERLDF